MEAAAHLLATLDQPETLTLRQVAREVGVAPASIYSHFPDTLGATASKGPDSGPYRRAARSRRGVSGSICNSSYHNSSNH